MGGRSVTEELVQWGGNTRALVRGSDKVLTPGTGVCMGSVGLEQGRKMGFISYDSS